MIRINIIKKFKESKAFTLIELIAVILVLGIIALISIPIVGNIIEDSKEGSYKVSAKNYLAEIETEVEKARLHGDDNVISDGDYEVGDIEVSLRGKLPDSGTFTIEHGEVVSAELYFSDYKVTYENGEYTITRGEIPKETVYVDGTAIYFNPVTATKCTESEANNNTNLNSGCLKWYAFLDNDTSTEVNVILDHDTSYDQFDQFMDTTNGPTNSLTALQTDTAGFSSTLTRSDSYTYNYGTINYTTDYTGMKARFITAEEVALITNITSFDITDYDNTKYLYDISGDYSWLISNMDGGYWTASATDDMDAWYVSSDRLRSEMGEVGISIRPVITIPKSLLK